MISLQGKLIVHFHLEDEAKQDEVKLLVTDQNDFLLTIKQGDFSLLARPHRVIIDNPAELSTAQLRTVMEMVEDAFSFWKRRALPELAEQWYQELRQLPYIKVVCAPDLAKPNQNSDAEVN